MKTRRLGSHNLTPKVSDYATDTLGVKMPN